MSKRDFFVGYLPASASLRRSAVVGACVIFAVFIFLAAMLGRTRLDIGASVFGEEIAASGIFVARPYPMLVSGPDAANPHGRTFLLGGEGKRGAQDFGAHLDQRVARLEGILVKRGDIDMALVSAEDQLRPLPETAASPKKVSLGKWRISGEICDGKCVAGGMRPGAGLAHKACANLCVSGGLPPVLVSASPVAGRNFFLLGAEDGGPAPLAVQDLMASPVALEGELWRLGNMLLFLVDWQKTQRH